MVNPKISILSKICLLIASVLFFCSLLFPMWQIDLAAPQYPEGLVLKLHANKIGGDVEIINGLNHYIGMKTLHTENFVEFKILPYIMIGFGLLCLLMIFIGNKKRITGLFIGFLLFVLIAGLDFYRWNYDYGHDLDPNAAIQVPGMAYQPPLIGYKQLLNFGAYSVPDTGGWMLVGAGLLLFVTLVRERNMLSRFGKKSAAAALLLPLMLACGSNEPKPVNLNVDSCDFCKMTISDGKFAAEVITQKGRYYKFDDITCMVKYVDENTSVKYAAFFVSDFTKENSLIDATHAAYLKGGNINSPMRGNIAAFPSESDATPLAAKLDATSTTWEEIFKSN